MSHTKGANGVNVPDEFSFGKLPPMPKVSRGRTAEPIDTALVAKIDAALKSEDDAICGAKLYSATVAELTEYNKDNEHPLDSLVKLAQRFALNASADMRRHAAVVAKSRGLTVGFRTVNEGNDDKPMIRWYLILTKPRPRAQNEHGA